MTFKFLYKDVDAVLGILKKAGSAIMDFYSVGEEAFKIEYKADKSPITLADLASNEIIVSALKERYPFVPIISEETELVSYSDRKTWHFTWLLDPLDGTKEFINRTNEFSINLALVMNGRAVAGFIYLPVFQTMYYAFKGKGAVKLKNGKISTLTANEFSFSQQGLNVVTSRSHIDSRTKIYIDKLNEPKIKPLGSALKFVSIADGSSDYYPRMMQIMEWDTAAGQIIIEEAGGSLVDAHSGNPLVYNKESMFNPFFIASGKII